MNDIIRPLFDVFHPLFDVFQALFDVFHPQKEKVLWMKVQFHPPEEII